MKKYHQLILLIISVISLSLFLIYRHEYNRLHYVLEVFNFFGQPCNFSDLQTTDFTLRQHDWGPQPIWQEIDNGYIYSAFLTSKGEVKALGLSTDEKKLPRNCYLWLEDKKKPITGKVSFTKIVSEGGSLHSYFYYCSIPNVDNTPYAVSFNFLSKRESDMKKILLTDISSHKSLNINTTICVIPSSFTKKRFVEFFSFHRLIGVESFIFYDKDIPYRLVKLIKNLSKRLDVQVSFLPWNFPKTDTSMTRALIENDCLYRTNSQSRFVAALELNEYIVPTVAFSITDISKDFYKNIQKIRLPVQRFCINNISMNKPIALQNYEVTNDPNSIVVRFMYKNFNNSGIDGVVQDTSRASIHKYVKCGLNVRTRPDFTMKKFELDFTRSTLVQLLIHNQL